MESSSFSGDSTSAGSEEGGRWIAPPYLHWSTDEVAEWVESLGFKQYRVSLTNCPERVDLGGWPAWGINYCKLDTIERYFYWPTVGCSLSEQELADLQCMAL